MNKKIKYSLGILTLFVFGMKETQAANLTPILGDLLSGNSVSSADGAFNPFDVYETNFVGMSASSKGYYTSNGLGVMDGDSLVGVTSFATLTSSITSTTGSSVGAGFGALVFAGEVDDALGGNFNLTTLSGGVSAALGNPASGASSNFLSLIVSDTVDFSSTSLVNIGNALNSGTALEVASFDVSTTNQLGATAFFGKGFTGGPLSQTTFSSESSLALDLVSSTPGIDFWTIDRDLVGSSPLYDVEASASYPFGSFGSELYLNLIDLKIGVDIDTTANTGQNFITSGNAAAAMNPVPEPSMLAIMSCMGVAGFVANRRRNRRVAKA